MRLPNRLLTPNEERRRWRAYVKARSDSQAARRLGISFNAFNQWRVSRGLPGKGYNSNEARARSADESSRTKAYLRASSDSEAARSLNISRSMFGRWRNARCLPAKHPEKRISATENVRRLAAYHAAETSQEAAHRLGISIGAFDQWRWKRKLPCKNKGAIIRLHARMTERERQVKKNWGINRVPERLRAYVAGFFDGEGCIVLCESRTRTHYSLRVSIAQARGPGDEIMRQIHRTYGGSLQKAPPGRHSWSPQFVWRASSLQAERFLRHIRNHVRVKRRQLNLALTYRDAIATRIVPMSQQRAIAKSLRHSKPKNRKRLALQTPG